MIIGSSFRSAFGFQNPNAAAATIVCVLVIIWTINSIAHLRNRWRIIILSVEIGLLLCLGMTGSRAGLVAVVVSLVSFHGLSAFLGESSWARSAAELGVRAMICVAACSATMLGTRVHKAFNGDDSVTNRFELWSGGLRLIHAAPVTGWGKGNSGQAYMQWIQDPAARPKYGGMVNSFLHVGAEFGLPLLIIGTAFCLFPVTGVLSPRRRKSSPTITRVRVASASILLAYLAANCFSTLWRSFGLTILPILALGASLIVERKRWKTIAASLALAAVFAAGLYYGGHRLESRCEWQISKLGGGAVAFSKRGAQPGAAVIFLPDRKVLGPAYGKEIRAAIAAENIKSPRFIIYPPQVPFMSTEQSVVCALWFGARAPERPVNFVSPSIFIFPTGGVSGAEAGSLCFVPGVVEDGFNPPKAFVAGAGRVIEVPNCGQDIRSHWKKVWKEITVWRPL